MLETRSRLAAELFDLLRPTGGCTSETSIELQRRALWLLEALASPADAAALEEIVRDESRTTELRHRALQSLASLAVSRGGLSDDLLKWVFSQPAAIGYRPGCLCYSLLIMAAHRKSLDITEGIGRMTVTIARALLIRPMTDISFRIRKALYRRCLHAGELDLELALSTTEFAESQAMVTAAFADTSRMAEFSAAWRPLRHRGSFRFLEEARPDLMTEMVGSFRLGAYRTIEYFGDREARKRAIQFLRHAQGAGLSVMSAAEVVAQELPELDALLARLELDQEVYSALVGPRLSIAPPPQYDKLFQRPVNIQGFSPHIPLKPDFLFWALRSGPLALKRRALRQLLHAEPSAAEAVGFEDAPDGMLSTLALGASAARGSGTAAKQLLATIAPGHVPILQRAQAIRSLRAVTPKPEGWTSLILRMLNDDTQYCGRYPVRLEAAMALARPFFEDGAVAMAALVDGVMDDRRSEDWHVLAALQTWTRDPPMDVDPTWFWDS